MSAGRTGDAGNVLAVETPESVAFRLELAGIGSRGLALLIDTAIIVGLWVVELLAVLALTWVVAETTGRFSLGWSLGTFGALAFFTQWGYFVYAETTRNGRTPGKKRVGLRVVRDDGGRIGFLEAAIRNILRVVDILPGVYGVGMAAMLASSRSKRLGDMAAGTVVVRDRGDLTLYFDGEEGPPATALVKEFLDRREDLSESARYQVAVEILAVFSEAPGGWTEPEIAGRLMDLAGLRESSAPVSGAGVTAAGGSDTVN
jgi:uncharacterized RDD family membrane protein YckC